MADDEAVLDVEFFDDFGGWDELWRALGVEAVREHARVRPGSRPRLWWRHDAPEALRRRLGGTGETWGGAQPDPVSRTNIHYGMPSDGSWAWRGVDPCDPPLFEGQAAYLDRLGLWLPGERRRAAADLFAPEAVAVLGDACLGDPIPDPPTAPGRVDRVSRDRAHPGPVRGRVDEHALEPAADLDPDVAAARGGEDRVPLSSTTGYHRR
jgi:hypothetical protein